MTWLYIILSTLTPFSSGLTIPHAARLQEIYLLSLLLFQFLHVVPLLRAFLASMPVVQHSLLKKKNVIKSSKGGKTKPELPTFVEVRSRHSAFLPHREQNCKQYAHQPADWPINGKKRNKFEMTALDFDVLLILRETAAAERCCPGPP